jgi:CheY-like chemotaxis protein
MLAELGHKVVGPVARLDEAQEMAQREAFDIAILDVNINGGEAYPIAEALAARDIPFVFSTGYGKESLRAPYSDRPAFAEAVPAARSAVRGAVPLRCGAWDGNRADLPPGTTPA